MGLYEAVRADNPIGFWPLDEPSGTTATDRSGNGRNGTATAGVVPHAGYAGMRAFDFDGGSNHNVSIAHDAAFNATTLSVEFWFYLDANVNNAGGGKGNGFKVDLSLGTATLYIMQSNGVYWRYAQVDPLFGNNELVHLVMTFDAGTNAFQIIKNGVARTITGSGGPQGSRNTTDANPLLLGQYPGFATVDGRMWGWAVYNTVLSEARALAHYQAGIGQGVGTPRMRPKLIDTFERPNNSSSLGTADSGQPWTINRGTWGITSGKPYTPTAAATPGVGPVATVDLGETVQAASLLYPSAPPWNTGGAWHGAVLRASDADNLWFAFLYRNSGNNGNFIYAGKCVAGTTTYSIANTVDVTAVGYPAWLYFTVDADNLFSVYFAGVQRGSSVLDSFNSTATKAGLNINNTAFADIEEAILATRQGSVGVVV